MGNIEQESWRDVVLRYRNPDAWRSAAQIATTLVPLVALWALMYWSLDVSYALTLALAVPAAGFLVRAFILFHDCGHGSFFQSQRANHTLGFITGVLTFTPYFYWRHNHAVHHKTSGNLDKRGTGDIWTLTADEYRALPPLRRLGYAVYRHPLFMLGFGSIFTFLVLQRFPRGEVGARERRSVHWTNLALLVILTILIAWAGWRAVVMVHLPVLWLAAIVGTWMFYVQHQFEDTYWAHEEEWNYAEAALASSSYYKLPRILQWFTGNIGFHHIHHLSSRIPNYRLEACYDENPRFQKQNPLTLRTSLKCLSLRLWDEDQRKLIGFADLQESTAA